MRLSRLFIQQSRRRIFVEMLVVSLLIGVIDFTTGNEIRLLPFYAGPIAVTAWFCGRRLGFFCAAWCGLLWWNANWFTGDPDLHEWIAAWETFRHLTFFFVVAWASASLRAKSDIAGARIELLEHSQRLEREIVNISDAEQRRIGQDLHDGLCQCLAALSCSATSLRDDLKELKLPERARVADELANCLREAVVQTRDLARGLVPAHVEQVGLALALDSLAQSVARLHGVDCSFHARGRVEECGEEVGTHLFRIAQEAINNALRHGGATVITLTLEFAPDLLTLRVRDNGRGVANLSADGLGLRIMRYRARLNGGDLAITHPEDGGTLLRATALLPTPEEDEVIAA